MNKEELIKLGLIGEQEIKLIEKYGNMIPQSRFNELQKKFPDSKIQVSSSGNNSNKLIVIIKPNNDIIWIMISHNKEFEDLGYDIKEIYNKVGFKLEQKTANMLVMKKNYEGVFFIKGNYKKLYFVHKYINIFEAQNIEKDEGLIESCMIN